MATGWKIGQSIAMEMDMALFLASGSLPAASLQEEMAAFIDNTAEDWRAQLPEMLRSGGARGSLLYTAAALAGSLLESDYSRATFAIRDMTLAQALDRLEEQARPFGLTGDVALASVERLTDLGGRLERALYTSLGFAVEHQDQLVRQGAQTYAQVARILRDGDLHTRFWLWLDQCYFAYYLPWRQTRTEFLAILEQRALMALGNQEMEATPPTAWLPAQNPLLRYPELASGIQSGQLQVFFWVEPFGITDAWAIYPGGVLVSFAEPGQIYQQFQAFAENVATRAHALADPTRLIILRLIRHFGAFNTEIAEYLQLSRPTVSVHAKILREAGLIESRQEGRLTRHTIVASEVRRLFRDLEQFLDLPEES